MAEGLSLRKACEALQIDKSTVFRWALDNPSFKDALIRARDIRAELAYPEQVMDIADDGTNDWLTAKNGALIVNKELVLRSKLRIEARQFQMSRLHRDTWGEKAQVDVKHDFSHMTEAQRLQKARELIGLVHEIQKGPELPPPLEYRPEEPEDDQPPPQGIGR